MRWIDLRSDTVTRPTPEMREAMARAEVGDDVYMEDPTVNRLQDRAAELFGREAALFVPSGTMGNSICVKLHTEPGQEVVIEQNGHLYNYEMASMAVISGALARPVPSEGGLVTWTDLERAICLKSPFRAQTTLICLENTHNMAGGAVLSKARMREICDRAHAAGLRIHLDGARIFNASVALGESVAELTRPFDSVMFCLSKGLGAPVGSMIVGSSALMDRGRRVRKMLGGGMRQAGVLAAAGLVALERMTGRLREDHENAQLLARGLAEIEGIDIDPERVRTNILIFDLFHSGMDAQQLSDRLKQRGVLANAINPRQMRMVTHYDVSREDCLEALAALRQAVEAGRH
ncbi:MAG: aminotransferase class I/II-fold pyridoxal phosphate-dependent enzyme [Acidobacteria bacterium]|nr:aminotransferase class I/II-fold pyridoxal phosphate-dependent enzyme [Acidobacteriota bacterium]